MMLLNNSTITISRKAEGTYVNGHPVDGTETNLTIKANVQPLTGDEILQLPEADRQKDVRKLFSSSEILYNDIVTYKSKNYEVQRVRDFSDHRLPHYKGFMYLVEGQ